MEPSQLKDAVLERAVRVGLYEVNALIGEGGMGDVYDAVDTEHGSRVALKTLRDCKVAPERLLLFKHEFRAMMDLTHPNLVPLYELSNHEGLWFFTMERVDGVGLLEGARNTAAKGARRAVGLFTNLAAERPLVLEIDDLQWADADSIMLLYRLLEAAPPRLMLCLSLRPDDAAQNAAVAAYLKSVGTLPEKRTLRVVLAPCSLTPSDISRLPGTSSLLTNASPLRVSTSWPPNRPAPLLRSLSRIGALKVASRCLRTTRGRPTTTLVSRCTLALQRAPISVPTGR